MVNSFLTHAKRRGHYWYLMSLFFNLNDIVVHIIALELLVLSLTEFFLMNFKMIVCGCSKYED